MCSNSILDVWQAIADLITSIFNVVVPCPENAGSIFLWHVGNQL
jgi:hypothetical protein